MRIVIVEDELPAASKLRNMLEEVPCGVEIVTVLASVSESLHWFSTNEQPDLLLMDIRLSDGLSLELIEKAGLCCPIIFITAYDEYWQEAFEHTGIDYLLKPFKKERLEAALNKFNDLKDHFTSRYRAFSDYQKSEKKFRERFLVKKGREYASIPSEHIAFFYTTHKMVCLVEKSGTKFLLDRSLSDIEKQVNPSCFFRINRKYLVHKNSISKITLLPKSKLLIRVIPDPPDELVISSENSGEFKSWMGH